MSQFTLYANQNKDSKDAYPYFVDIQNDLLNNLNTRLVIPLASLSHLSNRNIDRLCPKLEFNNQTYVLLTQQMTNIPVTALTEPVNSVASMRNQILAAIDLLITGF